MASTLTKRKAESGRTMVEIIGVITIMGVITTTAMMWWAKAMDQQRANTIVQEVGKRAAVYEQGIRARKGFVSNMYSDQEKIQHGYGITPAHKIDGQDGVWVIVGAINEGRAIQKDVCKLLMTRSDDKQQASSIRGWMFVDNHENKLEREACEDANTMAALVSTWTGSILKPSVIPDNPVRRGCHSSEDCGVNQYCDSRRNCIPCPSGYFRTNKNALNCTAGCAVTFVGGALRNPNNFCKVCNQATGNLEEAPENSVCGADRFGRCKLDNGTMKCDVCSNWDKAATDGQKTCGKCNTTDGSYEGDPKKNGTACFGGRGTCSGGTCVCDAARHFIPNNADEMKATGCVCDTSLHLKDNGSGVCVCDDSRGWTAAANGVCVCKAGWTMGADGVNCTPCGIGTYKTGIGNGACGTCPGGRLTVTKGATSVNECGCPPGQHLKDNKTCAKCNGVWDKANNIPNLYTSDPNNSASCNTCNAGNRAKEETKVINENLYTGYMSCVPCGKSSEGRCGCDASNLLMPNGKGGCGCTVGAFTNSKNSVVEVCGRDEICNVDERKCELLQCGPGKHVKLRDTGKGMYDPECTNCPVNKYKEGTNTDRSCTACDTANGYYTDSVGQSACKQCTGAYKQYNTSTKACECKPGFVPSGNDCICPAGKEISGNSCKNCASSNKGACNCGTKYPLNGSCVECTSNSHCLNGKTCQSNQCKCPSGTKLSGGNCVQCTSHDDCGASQVCSSNKCVNLTCNAPSGHVAHSCSCPSDKPTNCSGTCTKVPSGCSCGFSRTTYDKGSKNPGGCCAWACDSKCYCYKN